MTASERQSVLSGFFAEARRLAVLARRRALEALPTFTEWPQEAVRKDAFTGTLAEWLQGKP